MVLRRNARVNRPWTGGGRLAAVPAVSKANTSHDFIQHLHQQAGNRSVGQWLQRQSKAEAPQAADHSTGECPAPVPTGLPAFLAVCAHLRSSISNILLPECGCMLALRQTRWPAQ